MFCGNYGVDWYAWNSENTSVEWKGGINNVVSTSVKLYGDDDWWGKETAQSVQLEALNSTEPSK